MCNDTWFKLGVVTETEKEIIPALRDVLKMKLLEEVTKVD